MDATVTFKDGTSHIYQGVPDGTSPDDVEARASKDFGKPIASLAGGSGTGAQKPSGFVNTLADMARSIPGGLAQGVAGLAGLPGDVSNLLDAGMNKLTGANVSTNNPMRLTSQKANDSISQPFGGYYAPQTIPGQYTQTIAQFAPNAIFPGSSLARAARVAVPAVSSESAGQLAKSYAPSAEPLARIGGALAGGIGESLGESSAQSAAAINSAPTLDELNTAKQAAYQAADQAGVVISPHSWNTFATNLGQQITQNGAIHPDIHPNTLAALGVIQDETAGGNAIPLSRADLVRQAVNGAIEKAASPLSGNQSDLRMATQVKAGLDNYLDGLTPADTISGNPQVAVPILRTARDLASREFKGEQIQQMMDLAANNASTNYSSSGYEQALRVQFKNLNGQLIKNPALAATYTAAQRQAIQDVAQGGPVGNALRYLGKLAPTGVISTGMGSAMGAGAGGALGGPIGAGIGAMAAPTIGTAARAGATAITQRNAQLAAALMRAGGNGLTTPTPTLTQMLPPALLASVLANNGSQ